MTLYLPLRRNVQEMNFHGKVSGRAALQLPKTGIPTFKSCLERLNHPDNIKFQNLRRKNGEEEMRFHFSITEKPQRQRLSIIMSAQECPGDPLLCNQPPQISVASNNHSPFIIIAHCSGSWLGSARQCSLRVLHAVADRRWPGSSGKFPC